MTHRILMLLAILFGLHFQCTAETLAPTPVPPPPETQPDAGEDDIEFCAPDASCDAAAEPPKDAKPIIEGGPEGITVEECRDDPATPPDCFRAGPESTGIMGVPGADAWFDGDDEPPPGMCWAGTDEQQTTIGEVWLCNVLKPLPVGCAGLSGGVVLGFSTACCAAENAPELSCSGDGSSCPALANGCYTPKCWNGRCYYSHAELNEKPCGDAKICGLKRAHGPSVCGPKPFGPLPW